MVGTRHLSSAESKPEILSKNLSFRSAFDSPISQDERPLAIVYGWLGAKSRHIHKYGDFYLGKGFDVLHIKIHPAELLWPKRTQDVVQQIVNFAHERKTQSLLIHGFSVGAYLFGETLNRIVAEPKKYGHVMNQIVGQVFDSPVDYTGIPEGFSKAVTQIPIGQKILRNIIKSYMQIFYNLTTKHYKASSDIVKANPMDAPCLMLYSDEDPLSTPQFNEGVIDMWRQNGVEVFGKRFSSSPHVSHFHMHPVEYITQLNDFLTHIGLNLVNTNAEVKNTDTHKQIREL